MHARVHTHTCVLARMQAGILRRQLDPELTSLYYVAVVARVPARPPVPAATYARLRAATTVVRCRVTAAEIARCASAVITSSALRSSSRGELPYPSGMASDRSPSRSRRKRMSLLAGTVASATARWITRHTAPDTAHCPGPRAQCPTVCGGAAASVGSGAGSAPSTQHPRDRTWHTAHDRQRPGARAHTVH